MSPLAAPKAKACSKRLKMLVLQFCWYFTVGLQLSRQRPSETFRNQRRIGTSKPLRSFETSGTPHARLANRLGSLVLLIPAPSRAVPVLWVLLQERDGFI